MFCLWWEMFRKNVEESWQKTMPKCNTLHSGCRHTADLQSASFHCTGCYVDKKLPSWKISSFPTYLDSIQNYSISSSFFLICVCERETDRKRETERHGGRKLLLSVSSLPTCLQEPRLGQGKAYSSTQVHRVGGRCPNTRSLANALSWA